MQHLGCNLSKEIGRIRSWRGSLWERRYTGIVISSEPEAQWKCLKYLLSNSVKEGLCESPLDWPGIHAARSLVHGEPLEGFWFNSYAELCITVIMWSSRLCGVAGLSSMRLRASAAATPHNAATDRGRRAR